MRRIGLLLALVVLAGCDRASNFSMGDPSRLDRIAEIIDEGDASRAMTELEDYVRAYPRDDLAWTVLGNLYEDVDRTNEAFNAYDTAIAIDPKNFRAINGLGVLHRTRGNYDAAMQAYEAAVQINPNYAPAFSNMTTIELKRNDDRKALEYARKGYELDKSSPAFAANLAVAYHYNDDIENRDKFTRVAERLGYANIDVLQQIYSGEVTVRK